MNSGVIPPDTHTPRVDVHDFDIFNTMVSDLDLADLQLPTVSNFRSLVIDTYDVPMCEIEYTIIPHEALFPS